MATLVVALIIIVLVGLDIRYLWKNRIKKGQLGCCDCGCSSDKGGSCGGCSGCSR